MSRNRLDHMHRLVGFVSRRAILICWLLVVWVALWESASLATLLSGVVVAVSLIALFPAATPKPSGALRPFRPFKAARFAVFFLYRLMVANLVVAWEVITPRNKINQGVVRIPIKGVSDGVVTLVANAISLTPGTLTVEVRRDPTVLYVHVLHLRSVEEVRRDVQRLESLALEAFAPLEILSARTKG